MGYIERNREKMEQIYKTYKDDIYRVCLFFSRDEHAAHEIAQQTFFKFYQHIDQTKISSVRAYLVRTARNLCFNYLRDRKFEDVKGSWETLSEETASVISVEEVFLKGEQKRQEFELSRNILERLRQENEQWYMAMNLVYCLDKPHEVVADEIGISVDALYSMIYRAKRWIRKNYTEQYDEIVSK